MQISNNEAGHTNVAPDGENRSWRWRECPLMGSVGPGEQDLALAGHYDDGLSRAEVAELRRGWDEPTPTWRLDRQEKGSDQPGGLVLLLTGAFAPIHPGHVAIMQAARAALEERGERVAGGYLAPDHDGYVSKKDGGRAAIPAPWRIRLAQLALEKHPWLMVDPWLSLHTPRDVNYTEAYLRLQGLLDRRGLGEQAVMVAGEDNAGFALAFQARGRLVIVRRRIEGQGEDHGRLEVLARPELQRAIQEGRILVAAQPPEALGASSTHARRGQMRLHPAVEEALGQLGLDLGSIGPGRHQASGESDASSPPACATASPLAATGYALRGDLEWATSHWEARRWGGSEALQSRLEAFGQAVARAIERAFSEACWPDRPRQVAAGMLDLARQRRLATEIRREADRAGLGHIDLDPLSRAEERGHALDLCREFERAGPQLHGIRAAARPGTPEISRQLAALNRAHPRVVLIDDDVASGQTVQLVSELLQGASLEVARAEGLLARSWEGPAPMDVCDLRDFLLGSRMGGLAVGLDESTGGAQEHAQERDPARLGRAPYLSPWVDLSSRASIPPMSAQRLSEELWALNQAFFAGSGLSVQDAWEDSRAFLLSRGCPPGLSLEDLCWNRGRLGGEGGRESLAPSFLPQGFLSRDGYTPSCAEHQRWRLYPDASLRET